MSKQAMIALNEGSMTGGVVANIIEISSGASIGLKLPANHILWDCGQKPVAIGDTWTDGVFTRNGEALTAVPTAAEQIADLQGQLAAANAKNTAHDTSLQFFEDCLAEMAETVYA